MCCSLLLYDLQIIQFCQSTTCRISITSNSCIPVMFWAWEFRNIRFVFNFWSLISSVVRCNTQPDIEILNCLLWQHLGLQKPKPLFVDSFVFVNHTIRFEAKCVWMIKSGKSNSLRKKRFCGFGNHRMNSPDELLAGFTDTGHHNIRFRNRLANFVT